LEIENSANQERLLSHIISGRNASQSKAATTLPAAGRNIGGAIGLAAVLLASDIPLLKALCKESASALDEVVRG
jgi:hypothetical protein